MSPPTGAAARLHSHGNGQRGGAIAGNVYLVDAVHWPADGSAQAYRCVSFGTFRKGFQSGSERNRDDGGRNDVIHGCASAQVTDRSSKALQDWPYCLRPG